jgi:hypothetical protein
MTITHIRTTDDRNLCNAAPTNADMPLREAKRTPRAALECSVWHVCRTCLDLMQPVRICCVHCGTYALDEKQSAEVRRKSIATGVQ